MNSWLKITPLIICLCFRRRRNVTNSSDSMSTLLISTATNNTTTTKGLKNPWVAKANVESGSKYRPGEVLRCHDNVYQLFYSNTLFVETRSLLYECLHVSAGNKRVVSTVVDISDVHSSRQHADLQTWWTVWRSSSPQWDSGDDSLWPIRFHSCFTLFCPLLYFCSFLLLWLLFFTPHYFFFGGILSCLLCFFSLSKLSSFVPLTWDATRTYTCVFVCDGVNRGCSHSHGGGSSPFQGGPACCFPRVMTWLRGVYI